MTLSFSYIDCYNIPLPIPDPGLGVYTETKHNKKWSRDYIQPEATEFMQHFYATRQIPGYTRIGNNTLNC